jgi:hypothetical protein
MSPSLRLPCRDELAVTPLRPCRQTLVDLLQQFALLVIQKRRKTACCPRQNLAEAFQHGFEICWIPTGPAIVWSARARRRPNELI